MLRQTISWLMRRRGQTLIEFAFVTPIILVFLLGLIDFGIALDRRIVLDHAAREGARFAAVGGNSIVTDTAASAAEIRAYTADQSQGIASSTGAAGSDNYIDVCYEDSNDNGELGDVGDNVSVRIHYVHDFVTGFTDIFDSSIASIAFDPDSSARVEFPADGTPASCGAWPP